MAAVDESTAAGVSNGLLDPGLRQRIRVLARLAQGEGISGQAIAGQLGVSRMAVHKHVEALRHLGADIVSARGSGYRLASQWDSLAPEAVLPILLGSRPSGDILSRSSGFPHASRGPTGPGASATPEGPASHVAVGLPYFYRPAVGSTNEVLREAASRGAPKGAVAVTDHQVGGRGRLGRRWVSEPDRDVTFSVLLRPDVLPSETSRLVVCAALAVAEVVSDVIGGSPIPAGSPSTLTPHTEAGVQRAAGRPSVGIKWPNDVVIEGRKVCGILTEGSMDMDRLHWIVVGVGLNVNSDPRESVAATEHLVGHHPPAALREWAGGPVRRPALLVSLLSRLSRRFGDLEGDRWAQVIADYAERDVLKGSAVSVRGAAYGAAAISGVAQGIGPLGELLLRRDDGTVLAIHAGEATLRRS